ncbi:MAG: hypothetical protein JWP75_320 [Frondihabitans sp.]|nr:hypothetical protein [Frondihabitans sp.]
MHRVRVVCDRNGVVLMKVDPEPPPLRTVPEFLPEPDELIVRIVIHDASISSGHCAATVQRHAFAIAFVDRWSAALGNTEIIAPAI